MLRWVDGFEHYGVIARMTEGIGGGAAWSQIDEVAAGFGGFELSTANPATGGYHLRLTGRSTTTGSFPTKQARRVWGESKQVVGLGYRFMVTDLPETEGLGGGDTALVLAEIRDAANDTHFTVILGTDGSVVVRKDWPFEWETNVGAAGTEVGRSDPCVARGGYHHFELKTKIDNTTGYIEVRVNQVTVLNLTGIDTQNTANATAAQFVMGESAFHDFGADLANFGFFDVDDVFTWDDDASDAENTVVDFVGDKGCYWRAPNADTATSEWDINGSVTAYGAIDEVPPNGTDYLDDATGTARTIVEVEALPGNVAEVIAWVPMIYARKEDSGAVSLRGGVVVGADESYGLTDSPSTAYAYLRGGPKTINPDTGVAWANSDQPDLLIERTA
jgi:hypothetical protein